MSYITEGYYNNTYHGQAVSDFDRLATQAQAVIDGLTGYRIRDLAELSPFDQSQIMLATCAQVERIDQTGGVTLQSGSVTIGKFSQSNSATADRLSIAPMVYQYLAPTGLLYRGVR